MSIRMRHTRSHTKNRRSHHALVGILAIKDKETGTLSLPHRIDEATGMYRGKQIVVAKEKKVNRTKAKGPRTEAVHEHTHEKSEHKHDNAGQTKPRGFFGRVMNARPNTRSGAGAGGV
jgi:ribosomal protein L32